MGVVRVPKRRVFVGIQIPLHVVSIIDEIQECVEPYFDGRFTAPRNLHVTLKFLGEIDTRTLDAVRTILSRIDFEPATASIDRFGTFSDRILWAHVSGLEHLQAQVDEALAEIFAPENRFMSHLTIARITRVRNAPGLRACLKALSTNASWQVHHVDLIDSELAPHGSHYTLIGSYHTHADLIT